MRVLGIPIDDLRPEAIVPFLGKLLDEPRFHRIATVNPEFILMADRNPEFRHSLLSADHRLMDGVGLSLAFWFQGKAAPERIPGADLLLNVLQLAEKRGDGVALALHEHGLTPPPRILAVLKVKYPKLHCSLYSDNYKLQATNCKLLLCNYGAPFQEIFLEDLRHANTSIRLAMGVGGAFDFLTGAVPRAPKFFRTLGLEWLWRLFLQPRHFRRIWNAVVVFPFRLFFATIKP